jgi:hypothetical protein
VSSSSDARPPSVPGPRPSSGGNTAVLIVAIVAGAMLCVILICAGVFYFAFRTASNNMRTFVDQAHQDSKEWHEARAKESAAWHAGIAEQNAQQNAERGEGKRFAERFLTAIRERRFADAHRETTVRFREQFPSEKELEQFVQAHSVLSRRAMLFDEAFGQEGGTLQRFSSRAIEGELPNVKPVKLVVGVVKEGLNWKADELTVTDAFPPH